jgi:hypothetical protein
MKAFNTVTSALTGTALLASSVLAQLDPIVIKVQLPASEIVLGSKVDFLTRGPNSSTKPTEHSCEYLSELA